MKIDTMQIRQIYPVAQEIRDTFDKYRKVLYCRAQSQ